MCALSAVARATIRRNPQQCMGRSSLVLFAGYRREGWGTFERDLTVTTCQLRVLRPIVSTNHGSVRLQSTVVQDTPSGKPADGESPESSEAQNPNTEHEAAEPNLPQVLWRAPPLTKDFEATEHLLGVSAMVTGSGLGFALLGIAPFTPPNPFMVGLFLAILQVRLAHVWMTRQMRAQVRRHVVELVHKEGSISEVDKDTLVIDLKCDGGLIRTLRLVSPGSSEEKPSFGSVVSQGCTFTFFDKDMGHSDAQDILSAVLQSRRVVQSEDLSVKPFEEESQSDAEGTVQRLANLSAKHLKSIEGKDDVSPSASLAQIRRSAQISGSVILTVGFVVFLGGRYAADQSAAAAAAPVRQ